eukprot:s3096_g7.t1
MSAVLDSLERQLPCSSSSHSLLTEVSAKEAVSGALVARLPCKFLEVLSLWGTARLLRLEHFCLCGALAWYPPISDAWFSTLLQALRDGYGSSLRSLDIRQTCAQVLFGQVLPAWAARRSGTSSKAGGPLAGLRLVDFGSGDGRLVAAAAKHGMHATGYELNPYLVLWSRLRCFRALRAGPGSGQLRWANVWSADLRDADVVTVYGRPGDSFMEHAAKKLDEELPSNAAVVSHFFDVPGWERRLVQDVDGLKLYDFSLRGRLVVLADGPLSFASLIDWWDQARTVPNSLVSEKGSTLVASIKGRSYAATVAGLFGDTAVQRRWDQADAEGTLQALRQAYCRTWREVREYKAERDLRKAETECAQL